MGQPAQPPPSFSYGVEKFKIPRMGQPPSGTGLDTVCEESGPGKTSESAAKRTQRE